MRSRRLATLNGLAAAGRFDRAAHPWLVLFLAIAVVLGAGIGFLHGQSGPGDEPASEAEESAPPAGDEADGVPPEEAAEVAQEAPASIEVWKIRSPFPTLARTSQLLDTIGLSVLSDYGVREGADGRGKLTGRPGVEVGRLFSRTMADGAVRMIEIVAAPFPSGGIELYVRGSQMRGDAEEPNPDLPAVQGGIEEIVANVNAELQEAGAAPLDKRRLAYESFQLSYVEADRAMALLKALDYATVEFNELSGDTLYDRIFMPSAELPTSLPVVIKMVSASKTSLQESTADSGTYTYRSSDLMPDLGGVFLHRTTAAEPQNRLLIAYDPFDLPSLERLLNLLRDVVDVPARQLVLEALVIEIQSDATKDLGVTWGATTSNTAGGALNTWDLAVSELPRLIDAPLTFSFGRVTDRSVFQFTLHALLETSKAKILSNPSVLVLDGRQAKIQIGSRIPVVETTVTQTAVTESILYFPVGIVLNLRPRVSEDGSGNVSMQVETIVSSVRPTLASISGASAPEVESRQVQTFVRVQNDTPFIIGGLTTTEELDDRRGVPGLSQVPALGALFRRRVKEDVRKEIIIVVTPHLVPEGDKTFSYVIPQESALFDSFGHELLYNAYRIRQQDVFDLGFLFESKAYQSLVACADRYVDGVRNREEVDPAILDLLEGGIPGEEILIRRMLWEIVRKTGYTRLIDLNRSIFFEKTPKNAAGETFTLAFLAQRLAERNAKSNALVLTFDAGLEGTPERPFSQPTATTTLEELTPQTFFSRLAEGNSRTAEGDPLQWTILLTDAYAGTAAPDEVLRGILVLKALLNLNPNLPLSIRGFRAGRQIVFPTEMELQQGYNLLDPEAAEMFYEITSYYPAFETEFKRRARRLVRDMGGCDWWDASSAASPLGAAGEVAPSPEVPGDSTAGAEEPAGRTDPSEAPAGGPGPGPGAR